MGSSEEGAIRETSGKMWASCFHSASNDRHECRSRSFSREKLSFALSLSLSLSLSLFRAHVQAALYYRLTRVRMSDNAAAVDLRLCDLKLRPYHR